MPVTYASETAAERRAGALQKQGIWTGIIKQADGRYRLAHDPQDTRPAPADGGEDEDEQS